IRTQLYLDESVHGRVTRLARKQGRTLSDLVREALVRTYGAGDAEREITTLRAIAGLWKDRRDIGDTEEYVKRLRRSTRRRAYLSRLRGAKV
ncbi:MAG: CopG family transcriptional regulator, partial [Thermoplasmata archaeon]